MSTARKLNYNDQCAEATSNTKCIGQNDRSIGIGDRGVVTKMKKKELIIRYVPSEKEYSPQEIEQFQEKEEALFNYIINQMLYQDAIIK